MVDFSNIRKEEGIRAALKDIRRQGLNRAIEFPAIDVDQFMIKVQALDNPTKCRWGPWLVKDLIALPRILDLEKIKVKIFEKRPKSEVLSVLQIRDDKRFYTKDWSKKFTNMSVAVITPDELIEIIRYLQVYNELVAFI